MTHERQNPRTVKGLLMVLLAIGLGLSACQEPGGYDRAELQRDPGPPDEQVAVTAADPEAQPAEADDRLTESAEANEAEPAIEPGPVGQDIAGPGLGLAPVAEPAAIPPATGAASGPPETVAAPQTAEPVATPDPVADPVVEPARPVAGIEPAAATTVAAQQDTPAIPEPVTEVEPEPAVAAPSSAPATAPRNEPPQAPTLDLGSLETRLRKTKAIGVFTKLELKNEVGDLIKEVDEYHRNSSKLSLSQLEERFDLLVMKLLLLLQDGDPPLHQLIANARPTLWTTLADPDQFANVKGT